MPLDALYLNFLLKVYRHQTNKCLNQIIDLNEANISDHAPVFCMMHHSNQTVKGYTGLTGTKTALDIGPLIKNLNANSMQGRHTSSYSTKTV
jgi:hypothetical protein